MQQKQSSTRRLFAPENWIINLRMKLVKCCNWITAVCGAETWTLRTVDLKYPGSFEMWRWRRMEISWTDRVRNEEVLHRVKE
jgi:hypothetical protein